MDDGVLGARAAPRVGERSPILLVAAFAIAAGVIHAVALVQHFGEGFLYGVFFAVVAACQLAWGAWVFVRPVKRWHLAAGASVNIAIAGIWALSRTTGVPLVPQVGRPEAVGVIDVLATFDELAVGLFVIAILQPAGRVGRRLAGLSAEHETRLAAALVSATLFAITLGGHAH
ncbi:MAG: hypothetical protein M3071_25170 [Actinomycetota bacterium]|nr:hypothetical protein [Actinomycetota bacterium]